MKSKFKIKSIKENYIIAEKVAIEQIMSFLEFYNIDVEIYEEKERKQFEMVLEKVVQFVRLGFISFQSKDGKITVIQHIGGPKGNRDNDLSYSQYTGAIAEEADGYDEKQRNAMTHAVVGALTGIGADGIKMLGGQDLSASQCLCNLFLSV